MLATLEEGDYDLDYDPQSNNVILFSFKELFPDSFKWCQTLLSFSEIAMSYF